MALIPVRGKGTAPRLRPYWTSATLYEGQLLVAEAAGTVGAATDGSNSMNLIGVAAETVTVTSGVKRIMVYDDPDQIFRCRKASGTFTLTDVGLGVVTSGNASALSGNSSLSACLLGASDATNPIVEALKIVGLAFKADAQNDAEGIFTTSTTATEAYVVINPALHTLNNAVPFV